VTADSKTEISDWIGGIVADGRRVYEDPTVYFAEMLAGGDLEKRDRILRKYSEFEIMRAALSKQKYGQRISL